MKQYRTGVIFVHGIQGSPRQFDFLIRQLPDDVLVSNLLLPGHGATVREFRRADAEQWLNAVREECRRMRGQCERVYFIGHSMGCLLGLLVEQELRMLSGMLLICCPFSVRPTARYFKTTAAANLTKGQTDDPYVKAAWSANSVSARHTISYLFCIKPYIELFKLIRRTKKERLQLPPKTVFCFAERDEIVGRRSIARARELAAAQTETMKRCGHNYFTDEAKTRMIRILTDMIAD